MQKLVRARQLGQGACFFSRNIVCVCVGEDLVGKVSLSHKHRDLSLLFQHLH